MRIPNCCLIDARKDLAAFMSWKASQLHRLPSGHFLKQAQLFVTLCKDDFTLAIWRALQTDPDLWLTLMSVLCLRQKQSIKKLIVNHWSTEVSSSSKLEDESVSGVMWSWTKIGQRKDNGTNYYDCLQCQCYNERMTLQNMMHKDVRN